MFPSIICCSGENEGSATPYMYEPSRGQHQQGVMTDSGLSMSARWTSESSHSVRQGTAAPKRFNETHNTAATGTERYRPELFRWWGCCGDGRLGQHESMKQLCIAHSGQQHEDNTSRLEAGSHTL